MAKTKLDSEEQELLEAYESGKFESDLDADRREYVAKAAEETFKKDKRINIRISSRDLEALQRRALEEGLPYQSPGFQCSAQVCLRWSQEHLC